MECVCGHDMWEHEVEETVHEDGDESLYFLGCTHEDCDCKSFEEVDDTI